MSESREGLLSTNATKLGIMKAGLRSLLLVLVLGGTHAQAEIIVFDEQFGVSLPIAFGGLDAQAGVRVSARLSEPQVDLNNLTIRNVALEETGVSSLSDPVERTFDTNSDLGESGFRGSATASAGDGQVNVEHTVTSISATPTTYFGFGTDALSVGASAVDYQLLRFDAAFDGEIEATAFYSLTASIMESPSLLQAEVASFAAFQVFSLSSFIQTGPNPGDGFLPGIAQVALFDVVTGLSPLGVVDNSQTIQVRTNTDYIVLSGASVSVAIRSRVDDNVDLSAMAAASTSGFTVSDPRVSIARSFITSNSQSVPEPGSLALFGLACLGLCLRRR